MTPTTPRSITEAKRAEAAASFSAACAKAAYRTNETPENYRAHMDASVAYMGASRACCLLKRRKHGARGLVAWHGRDAVSVRSGREHRGRIATEARKAERAARREAERAAQAREAERELARPATVEEIFASLAKTSADAVARGHVYTPEIVSIAELNALNTWAEHNGLSVRFVDTADGTTTGAGEISEVGRLLLAAKAEQETRGKPDTLLLDRETVCAIDDASAGVRS